jgi:hypothetical protein
MRETRRPPPPEKLETKVAAILRVVPFQLLISLLPGRVGGLTMQQRTRPSRHCCNPRLPRAGSPSLGC